MRPCHACMHTSFQFFYTGLPKQARDLNEKAMATPSAASPKRFGIVVRQQNYYSNGAGQNCVFMKDTLEALGYAVDFLVSALNPELPTKPHPALPDSSTYIDVATIDPAAYSHILLGAAVLSSERLALLRAAKVRISMFNPCNPFDAFHNEHFLYKDRPASLPLFESKFKDFADDVWITGNHAVHKTYLSVLNRQKIPMHVVPLVWNPLFIGGASAPVYQPRPAKTNAYTIVIIEPNMGYCKSAWLPLMIAEKLHQDSPDRIQSVYLFNSPTHETATGMLDMLTLHEAGKLKRFARLPIHEILAFFANPASVGNSHVVFVSYQDHLPVNYAYYDVLYCGFPFVHNSPYLNDRGLGYYYHEVDVAKGVQAFQKAMLHDIDASLAKARAYLSTVHPTQKDVVSAFAKLL